MGSETKDIYITKFIGFRSKTEIVNYEGRIAVHAGDTVKIGKSEYIVQSEEQLNQGAVVYIKETDSRQRVITSTYYLAIPSESRSFKDLIREFKVHDFTNRKGLK